MFSSVSIVDLAASSSTDAVTELYRHVRAGKPVLALLKPRAEREALVARLRRSGVFATEAASAEPLSLANTDAVVVAANTSAAARRLALTPLRRSPRRRVRVTLLGLGTVGTGVYRRLAERSDSFEVVATLVRDGKKPREAPASIVTTCPATALAQRSDIVVELLGGETTAADCVRSALQSGRHVVTANKSLIASEGPRLEKLAAQHGVCLEHSASVGGAVPVLERIDAIASAGSITSVRGLLSGTANFILSALARGEPFAEAVSEAQSLGLAEADPTKDLSGRDTAEKLAIIARHAFATPLAVDRIDCSGIEGLGPNDLANAPADRPVLGLLASCERVAGRLVARVAPTWLEETDPLAGAENEENRVVIESDHAAPRVLRGLGAGRWPTTAAVFADIQTAAERTHRGDNR